MTDLKKAAQQALEALEAGAESWRLIGPAIDALRAALEQPNRAQKMRDAGYTRRPTVTELQQAMVDVDLVDPDAIDDPEGYDGGVILEQIDALHKRLTESQA